MSISLAKSLSSLYSECKQYDLVLVPDAPLASALNRHLDQPHFGPFAITPRRLAAGRKEEAEDRQAFLEVIHETNLSWKQCAYEVGNILQCWEHQGTPEAILEYEEYATDVTRNTVECIKELDTTSGNLTDYSIDSDTDVAVVGIDQFTALERSIFPPEYDVIDPFADEGFDHPPFRILDSPAAIVDVILDTVTEENAGDIGVVLDSASEYSPLVESALEANDIPYYGGPGFTDDAHHRAFLQLLRCIHASQETRAEEVRPLLTQLGMSIAIDHDEKCISDIDDPGINWLQDFRETVRDATFETAIEEYEAATETSLAKLRDELETLGILAQRVTESAIDKLEFYLQTYEVPVDRENDGVLLADAKSAAHVDRPLVFFLGMDEDWTHSAPQRPWVDETADFDRNIRQFQLLLQSGVDQYYLVQDAAGGNPVTPCLYFEELLEESFERFSDLESRQHSRPFRSTNDGFDKQAVEVSTSDVDRISQSSLSTYVNSPRDYYFDRILDGPDKDYFAEGNLFHDFAEFYATHPDQIEADDFDELAVVILEEVKPFLREVDEGVRRTHYRIGLETIVEYLDANPPTGDKVLPADSGWGRNFFAEYYDLSVDETYTEYWFENDELGMKGKIDLVQSPNHLLDYKSGSKKSAYSVVKNSQIDPPGDEPNFQALLYLTHHRTIQPDEELQLTFFHFLETLDDILTGQADLDDCLATVTYYPVPFEDYIASEEVFMQLQDDAANKCEKTFSQTDYETYRSLLDANEFPDTRESDELIDSAFGQALIAEMKASVGDYKYVQRGCEQALRHLLGIRNENYFADDLDAFEEFVQERLEELNQRRAGDERFPVEGLGGEPNYRYVNNRDCLLEGETR